MRYLVGGLGLALVVAAIVVWLLPVNESVTTVVETSTTQVTEAGADDAKTTEAVKSSKTTEPGNTKSDAVLSVLLGTGGVLLLVAAFWGRISEIGLPGGGSIKLTEAQIPAIDVNDVADRISADLPGREALASGADYAAMMTSSSEHIVQKTREVITEKGGVVLIDLGRGDRWLLSNVFFLALMLERWTCVSLLVFTTTRDGDENVYVACSPPKELRRKLEEIRPGLGQARVATESTSLDQSGNGFFSHLGQVLGEEDAPATWVDGKLLVELVRPALTLEAVNVESRLALNMEEMRAVLTFPHRYVPATSDYHLIAIIDQTNVALRVGRFAVRKR